MSKDTNPLSPTLIRFQKDLQLNGLNKRSQQSYGRAVRKLSEFLKREPDSASEEDVRNHLLFNKNDLKWSPSTKATGAMHAPVMHAPVTRTVRLLHVVYRGGRGGPQG